MKTLQSAIENTRNGFRGHGVTSAKFPFPPNGEFNTVLPANLTVSTGEFHTVFTGEFIEVLPANLTPFYRQI